MAIRTGLSKSEKNEIRHIVEEHTERDGGSFSPPLSYVYKAHIKPKFPARQHRDIRNFLKEEYLHPLILGGLRFTIGLFTPSGKTPAEAAAEPGVDRSGMDEKRRKKIIRELEYWYNRWGDWNRVLSHANTEQGHNEMGLSPPPRPKEIKSVYRKLRGRMQSPPGSIENYGAESYEAGFGVSVSAWGGAAAFSVLAPFILIMALMTGGTFRPPTWLSAGAIIAALAGIYGWWRMG